MPVGNRLPGLWSDYTARGPLTAACCIFTNRVNGRLWSHRASRSLHERPHTPGRATALPFRNSLLCHSRVSLLWHSSISLLYHPRMSELRRRPLWSSTMKRHDRLTTQECRSLANEEAHIRRGPPLECGPCQNLTRNSAGGFLRDHHSTQPVPKARPGQHFAAPRRPSAGRRPPGATNR